MLRINFCYYILYYLYNEKQFDPCKINDKELDCGLLFVAMNVGLRLKNEVFYSFVKISLDH